MYVAFHDVVKPSFFNLRGQLRGSRLQKYELEIVAYSIIFFSRENGDRWFLFTFEDYERFCGGRVYRFELNALQTLVDRGMLEYSYGSYFITDKFVSILSEFIQIQ